MLHKTRRMAIFTATNIDGATYLSVDRQSGQVGDSEGEKWFKDTRVSVTLHLNQDFYSGMVGRTSTAVMTRRTDPTWGTAAEAERANADTFHFANCSGGISRFQPDGQVLAAGRRALRADSISSLANLQRHHRPLVGQQIPALDRGLARPRRQ